MTPRAYSIADLRAGRVPGLAAPKAKRPRPPPLAPPFEGPPGALLCVVPLRTVNVANTREFHYQRAKRVAGEHLATLLELRRAFGAPPPLPLRITLARVAPTLTMETDGAVISLKGARDSIADWLGTSDRDRPELRWQYGTWRDGAVDHEPRVLGPYGVRVMIERLVR